ncbi:hypothetical protein [Campylobacter hyointestinalis]|uniref:hypothetical protein n=1 Tax=Campylobacter hyointestinalis TaxID=198 RepID=UPI000DCE3713|nr:hypothetical protein [Campylobacter hyointestinalis]RAZ50026.1 hypothetical protein CHL9004_03675 [Campylobacter hyointestinalis subsp. lawsonii]
MIRYIFLALATMSLGFCEDNSLERYQNILKNLTEAKTGLTQKEIENITNPFFKSEQANSSLQASPDSNQTAPRYRLYAIFNNKVKINNLWYKLNDKIDQYDIYKIKKSSVVLKNQEELLELNIIKGNQNVSITYR